MQILFFASAYIVHQYFGVGNSENFASDVALQAANPMASLVMQAIGTGFGAFLLPALMFSVLTYGSMGEPLKLTTYPSAKQLLLTLGIILAGGIFISLLVDINKLIPLPDSLSSLKNFQEKYDALMSAYFKDADILRFVFIVLVLAVTPAIGEELFFRGALMKVFSETRLGIHGAVVFSALAFALMHFEFYNTLAIFFMGLMLGYIYVYTQSIWASIAAHFINNFLQVLLKYLFVSGYISTDFTTNESLPIYQTMIAGIITFVLLWLLWKNKTAPATLSLSSESINEPDTL